MTYNLMHYPGTLHYDNDAGTFVDRTPVLREIIADYLPDIFMICEIKEAQAADHLLQDALLPVNEHYEMANFVYNQSSSYTELQQMLFYNTQKLTLSNQEVITTYIRDINQYSFILNTATPLYLEVFVAHLKASSGETNENKRLQMVEQLTNHLANLPTDSYVIFGGDFNFYSGYEPGYQKLLDPANAIRLVDPINRYGYWHNNSDFTDIHTQSPLQSNDHFISESGDWDGVTGGLDDRFDFILISENLENGTALTYVPDTYKSYGNNGNCFNGNINDTDCDGDYSQEIRDLLFHMSDHLPVVMELETAETIVNISDFERQKDKLTIIGKNYAAQSIELQVAPEVIGKQINIYDQLGKKLGSYKLTDEKQLISIVHLNKGIYYLSSPQFSLHSPLKFVKI